MRLLVRWVGYTEWNRVFCKTFDDGKFVCTDLQFIEWQLTRLCVFHMAYYWGKRKTTPNALIYGWAILQKLVLTQQPVNTGPVLLILIPIQIRFLEWNDSRLHSASSLPWSVITSVVSEHVSLWLLLSAPLGQIDGTTTEQRRRKRSEVCDARCERTRVCKNVSILWWNGGMLATTECWRGTESQVWTPS